MKQEIRMTILTQLKDVPLFSRDSLWLRFLLLLLLLLSLILTDSFSDSVC